MKELIKEQARKAYDSTRDELMGVGLFVGAIWLVFLLDQFLPLQEYLALVPRTLRGLIGIFTMPLVHRDLSHILSNTFPLFVLMALLAGSRANSRRNVLLIIVGSGSLIWLAAHDGSYVGASALVFGLTGFLVASGFLEQRPVSLLISIVVGVMYGWTAIMGILPLKKDVSELAHFYGLVTGVSLAYLMSIGATGISLRREAAATGSTIDHRPGDVQSPLRGAEKNALVAQREATRAHFSKRSDFLRQTTDHRLSSSTLEGSPCRTRLRACCNAYVHEEPAASRSNRKNSGHLQVRDTVRFSSS